MEIVDEDSLIKRFLTNFIWRDDTKIARFRNWFKEVINTLIIIFHLIG